MAYLYEDKELVYEKLMEALKKRVVLVNFVIFASNLLAILILILNAFPASYFIQLVIPVFVLNLVISYAMVINRDSHQQLYLAMYTSIIGIIIVVINIFLIVQTPATYLLIYFAIAIISIYNDKKAVSIGYVIVLIFGTIIHFNHTESIIGVNANGGGLTPLLYQGLLIITLIVQTARTFYNEAELDQLYDDLEGQKMMELKYHATIHNLLDDQGVLFEMTDRYLVEETRERLNRYIDLFNDRLHIKGNLQEKMALYLDLQKTKDPKRVIGRGFVGYQTKKEINQYKEMALYKNSKLLSQVLAIKSKNQEIKGTDEIANFGDIFINPEMSIEVKIIGFILLYDQLRRKGPRLEAMTHEAIVEHFKSKPFKDRMDKEILEFFLENEEVFAEAYEVSEPSEKPEQDTLE